MRLLILTAIALGEEEGVMSFETFPFYEPRYAWEKAKELVDKDVKMKELYEGVEVKDTYLELKCFDWGNKDGFYEITEEKKLPGYFVKYY